MVSAERVGGFKCHGTGRSERTQDGNEWLPMEGKV